MPNGTDDRSCVNEPGLRATLLGPFSVARGHLIAGPWERPTARRLFQLVLLSPARRIRREAASEVLFPQLGPDVAIRSLNKAIAMARRALDSLGQGASAILVTERGLIRADFPALEVDLEAQETALRAGLAMVPGRNATKSWARAWRTNASFWRMSLMQNGHSNGARRSRSCARKLA